MLVIALTLVAPLMSVAQELPATRPTTQGSAEQMLKAYESLRSEPLLADKLSDKVYYQSWRAREKQAEKDRTALAWRFFEYYPDDGRAGALLLDRWKALALTDPRGVMAELEQVIGRTPAVPARAEAMYVRAALNLMRMGGGTQARGRVLVDEFIAAYPKDERGVELLQVVAQLTKDPVEARAIEQRIARDFPDSAPARMARAEARRAAAVGKPFELAFTDAMTGAKVSLADMKGKVVVVHFWATWCAPCIAELPILKKLYAEYHDKGLEIVGVSLDRPEAEGGLAAMKAFVSQNEVPWPQYYQGNHFESAFSSGWGVNGIPADFVVDRAGNLHTLEGHGRLEQLVPELLDAPQR